MSKLDSIRRLIRKIDIYRQNNFSIDSQIINTVKDYDMLNHAIEESLKIDDDKIIDWNLLYRATRDGATIDDYHQNIDDKGPAIYIIKTNKGNIFGAFINVSIHKERIFLYDPKSFLFSINKKKIYKSIPQDEYNPNPNITCSKKIGFPILGCIWPSKENFLNNKSIINKSMDNYYNWNRDYELNDGEKYFYISEYEVFGIDVRDFH